MTTNFKLAGLNERNDQKDIILISDSTDGYFEELCSKYSDKNIHWLKNVEERLIWKQSTGGDLSKLRDFIDKNTPQFIEPKIATAIKEKLVVIVSEPGMGKSTLLSHLALQTKKSVPSSCILKINLIDNAERFQSWQKKRTLTEIDIKDFLYSCYLEKTNEGPVKALEKIVFNYCYQDGKVIVMLDGFDEISPDYKMVVIEILKVLKTSTIKGLWITTRPYNIQSEIENVLNIFSYFIEPISAENQISFLKSYWAQNLKMTGNNDAFIAELLGWFSEITNDENGDFVAIPLQLRMIAEIFENKFEELIKSGRHELSKDYKQTFGEKFNLVILYEKFIDIKFNKILMQEKTRLNTAEPIIKAIIKERRINFIENHKKLALLWLFGTAGLKLLHIEIGDLLAGIKEGKEKTGIIDRVIEEKPMFVHKSYAEYFAALWFSNNWKENKVKNFLTENIFKEENHGIRRFFDYLLGYENNNNEIEEESVCHNKYALHISVLNVDKKKLKQLLEQRNSFEVINGIDEGGRTALHLMASYKYFEMFDILKSESIEFDTDKKDKLFGWSPIIYAEKSGSWNNAESLLQAGVNNDELFKQLDNINGIYEGPNKLFPGRNMTLLHIATSKGLLNFIKVLIKRGSDVIARDGFGRSTLHYAVLNGNQIIVEVLIKHLKEKNPDKLWEFINMKDIYGNNALHYTAQEGKTEVAELLLKLVETKFPEIFLEFINTRTNDGFTALLIVAQEGKTDFAEMLLILVETKIPEILLEFINTSTKDGFTALLIAAHEGKTEVVEFLLKLVKRNFPEKLLEFINAEPNNGITALNIAVYKGNTEIVKLLLKLVEAIFPEFFLEFINAKTNKGRSALFMAAQEGKTEVVELLLKFVKRKFPEKLLEFINAEQNNGFTALNIAVYKGNTKIVKLLLKLVETMFPEFFSKFINMKTTDGFSALLIAAQVGNTEVVELLIKSVETTFPKKLLEFITAKQKNGFTALHIAAQEGKKEVVELLLKLGETKFSEMFLEFINAKTSNGRSALFMAAQEGKTEVVELLLKLVKRKFPEKLLEFINAEQKNGFTALNIAVYKGNTEIVKLLLKLVETMFPEFFFKFINVKTTDGFSALLIAAQVGKTEIVELLIKSVETTFPKKLLEFITAKQKNGFTALHIAALEGKTKVVEFLIKYLEKSRPYKLLEYINEKDHEERTALHVALMFRNPDIIKFLIHYKSNVVAKNNHDTILHQAVIMNNEEILQLILNEIKRTEPNMDSYINASDSEGDTPLMWAAVKGHLKMAKMLLEYGANLDIQNNDGETALHLATKDSYYEVVKLLLHRNANLNINNKNGSTPIKLAVEIWNKDPKNEKFNLITQLLSQF